MDATPILCPQCHQPVTAEAYYCPNCGKSLKEKALATDVGSQVWIYIFSAVLPWIAYLAITKWPAVKYARSEDPAAKQIGYIAIAVLVISSIIAFWLTVVWIQQSVSEAVNSVGNLGGF